MISVLPFVNAVAVSVKANEVVLIAPFTMLVGKTFVPPISVAVQRGVCQKGVGKVTVTVQLAPGAPAKVNVN